MGDIAEILVRARDCNLLKLGMEIYSYNDHRSDAHAGAWPSTFADQLF